MSVTAMLAAETAFNFQLKLLVAPQSCLHKCEDRSDLQQNTHINHPARIEIVSMYVMKAHGGVEV